MDDEIAMRLGGRLRVVTRSGSATDPADLALVNLRAARTVIVPAPETDAGLELEPRLADTVVLKALLAVTKADGVRPGHPHIVAELKDARTQRVARQVVGPSAALVLSTPLISRLLVQTGRQSGLSAVYTELLDFSGCEIYTAPQPGLTGKTFREAVLAYEDSAPLGVLTAAGELQLGAFEHRFGPGDQLVVLSEDDDTIRMNARPSTVRTDLMVDGPATAPSRVERTLVLGASERLELVLGELDAYAAPGSEVTVVGDLGADGVEPRLQRTIERLQRVRSTFQDGDVTDREVLDSHESWGFDHVIVLAETRQHGHEMADARTLITLLHLRDQGHRAGRVVPVTTEMLDLRNQALAQVTDVDDFIVSDTLVSLMMTQVAENPHLVRVFDELFSPEGHELYLKPAVSFVRPGVPVSFATVVESAARKGMVALGHRVGGTIRLNPKKSALATYGDQDKVVVLAVS
jgi:voltage-gated potassium channel Kch